MRTDIPPVQTVCKGYQQTTKDAASMVRVKTNVLTAQTKHMVCVLGKTVSKIAKLINVTSIYNFNLLFQFFFKFFSKFS